MNPFLTLILLSSDVYYSMNRKTDIGMPYYKLIPTSQENTLGTHDTSWRKSKGGFHGERRLKQLQDKRIREALEILQCRSSTLNRDRGFELPP